METPITKHPEFREIRNAHCKAHKWYGHPNEECPLCGEARRAQPLKINK